MKRCHIRRGLSRVCEESSGPDEVTEDAMRHMYELDDLQ